MFSFPLNFKATVSFPCEHSADSIIMSLAKVANSSEYIARLHRRFLPVYVLYKLTGMLPMQISGRLLVRRSDIYYTIFYFVVYACLCVYSRATFPEQPTNVSEPRNLVILWVTTIVACQMLIIVFSFRYRGALVTGLNNIARLDIDMQELRIGSDELYTPNMWMIVFLLGSVVARSAIVPLIVELNYPQKCTTFIATLAKTMCKYQFAMLITFVTMRFQKINGALTELMHPGRGDDVKEEATRRARLQRLTRVHFKLCNVCKNIHDALSFTLLLSMIQTAVDIFQHTFYLYLALTKSCEGCGFLHYLCPLLWLLDEGVETINLVRACENVTAEVRT